MTERLRVLIVDDSESDAKLIAHELRRAGGALEFERVQDAKSMGEALRRGSWDIVISDWAMPSFSGLDALNVLKASGQDTPFIIVSGTVGEETAVAAMRGGARDFFLKDKLSLLPPVVEREVRDSRALSDSRKRAARELRQVQDQLAQAQKMEAVGRLAGGVAHDFNNLLSVILSYSEMGIRSLQPGEPLRADLEEIRKAGERAAELTRQLLAFSRQQVLEPKVINLNDLVGNVSKMLTRIIGEDVQLSVLPNRELGSVVADPGQIEQVLMNLVVNARDAMPTGGRLTIETANVELDADYGRAHVEVRPGSYVMLAVSDSGIGMDKDTQARIFEPFYTTKPEGKGTGLGLSTVFGIVKQSNGHVWVYSEPGKGTTFKLYFPRSRSPADPLEVQSEELVTLGGQETILLVEDEAQIRVMILGLLRKLGYHVLEARNGGEALILSEKHPARIHLLLTDVVMPHMSGAELAKRLLQTRSDLRVLCMSGYTNEAILNHGIIDAGLAYLQKPITPDRLARKIREVLVAK